MPGGRVAMPFGKYRGQDVGEVPSGYFEWLLEQEWFEEPRWADLREEVENEMEIRDRSDAHFYD